jgi:ABC-type sugar transport system ATPase subunit
MTARENAATSSNAASSPWASVSAVKPAMSAKAKVAGLLAMVRAIPTGLNPGTSSRAGHPKRQASCSGGGLERAVHGIGRQDVQVRAGEVVGLGGLVGSGRTELLRLIYGLDPLDEGEIVLEDKPLRAGHPRAAIRRGLGLAPEDRKSQALVLDWSETKNVTIADLGRFSRVLLDVRKERDS